MEGWRRLVALEEKQQGTFIRQTQSRLTKLAVLSGAGKLLAVWIEPYF